MKQHDPFKIRFDNIIVDPQDYMEMKSEADHLGITSLIKDEIEKEKVKKKLADALIKIEIRRLNEIYSRHRI